MATTQQVIDNFVSGKVNRYYGSCTWRSYNVFCEENVIYSYGKHYPLGVKLGKGLVLVNGDHPGFIRSTTPHHRSILMRKLDGKDVIVAFSAIRDAGFDPLKMTYKNIVHYLNGTRDNVAYSKKDRKYYEISISPYYGVDLTDDLIRDNILGEYDTKNNGEFQKAYIREQTLDNYVVGYWHRLGGTLLRRGRNYYLSALDEGSYFVSLLPRKADTVFDAYNALKPGAVINAERNGIPVRRQGEWFFVKTDNTDDDLMDRLGVNKTTFKSMVKQRPLPYLEKNTNVHVTKTVSTNDKFLNMSHKIHKIQKDILNVEPRYVEAALKEAAKVLESHNYYVPDDDSEIMPALCKADESKYLEIKDKYYECFKIKDDMRSKIKKMENKLQSIQGGLFAIGKVYHRNKETNRRSGEHSSIHLDGWHEVFKNTERASWGALGYVD